MTALRQRRLTVAALACLSASLAPQLLEAQPGQRAPLFASQEIIELTLTVPLRTLVTRRARKPDVVGTIAYAGPDGAPVTLDVEVTTRGRSRLELCSFPPLRLNLVRSQVEGTLFAGQNRLKLVTLCRETGSYEQYLQLEYLVYRLYEQISDHAYSARPVHMRYVDTERDGRIEEAPGFLLEPLDGLAARVGLVAAEVPSIERSTLEPGALATVSLFHFMIGNTDYSVTAGPEGEDCCHNSDVLAQPGGMPPFVVVPYDFDQAGLINTAYASPNEQLGLRSVRERLYRGLCSANAYLDETIARFNTARPAVEALLRDAPLNDDFREDASEYIAEFYEIVNDPERLRRNILERCRGSA